MYLDVSLVFFPIGVLQLEDGLADGTGQSAVHVRLDVKFQTFDFVTLKIENKVLICFYRYKQF